MNNKLSIDVDDHFAKIISRALREQAKREKKLSRDLHILIADQVDRLIRRYQEQEGAVLTELRCVKSQIASTLEECK